MRKEQKLNELHISLPTDGDMACAVYEAVFGSLVSRSLTEAGEDDTYRLNGEMRRARHLLTVRPGMEAPAPVFAVTGIDGCGKTTSLLYALRGIPDRIMAGGDPMLPYLYIDCIGARDSASLFRVIGRCIDFNAQDTAWRPVTEHLSSLDVDAERMRQLVRYAGIFGTALVVFDHVEYLEGRDKAPLSCLPELIGALRRAGVSVCFAGTKGACRRLSGQTGEDVPCIDVSGYCSDREFFDRILRAVFACDIFEKPVEPDEEISDTLYDLTKGSIGWVTCLCRDAASDNSQDWNMKWIIEDSGGEHPDPVVGPELFSRAAEHRLKGLDDGVATLIMQDEE